MNRHVKEAVGELTAKNPHAKRALEAMLARGMPHDRAEAEIARAVLGALSEVWNIPGAGKTVRLNRYLEALEKGAAAELLVH